MIYTLLFVLCLNNFYLLVVYRRELNALSTMQTQGHTLPPHYGTDLIQILNITMSFYVSLILLTQNNMKTSLQYSILYTFTNGLLYCLDFVFQINNRDMTVSHGEDRKRTRRDSKPITLRHT